ncbi:MAG: hypothetical protein IIA83_02145 [Thaumarchaeota archaeon]|nr:hypothetical protein [Nitrososphaerota archaeon]
MTKIEISKEFIFKSAKSLLHEYDTAPKLPPRVYMYTPRHNKMFLICKDVTKFQQKVIENFPDYMELLDFEIPTEKEVGEMSGTAREHHIERVLHKIIDVFESIDGQEKKLSSDTNIIQDPKLLIENIISKFHEIHTQLQIRYNNRETITIKDEYDVQNLLNALLRLHFDDIRPEEPVPSYANSFTKADFFIPKHEIMIECKIKTSTHIDNKIKDELILDKEQYKKSPKCKLMYCLIYDPHGEIKNPRGFERSINEKSEDFECICFIVPKK